MEYQALYRKYRPKTFDDVKGQDVIVRTLRNQVRSGRIGHAYLFCGSRGTGKTTCAKILGKAVNCAHPVDGNPCGECESCRSIDEGNSMNLIEMDAASRNGVEDFRRIIDEIAYPPAEGKKKVYIIDEVHMLSTQAFNAFLKTLEEPPEYAVFLLATTDPQKLPATVLSRCQRYDFRRIPLDVIAARLREVLEQEGVRAREDALRAIARRAEGGMRDALSIADQCVSFFPDEELTDAHVLEVLGAAGTDVYRRMLRSAAEGDAASLLMRFDALLMDGKDVRQIISDFTWYLRGLHLFKASGGSEGIEELAGGDRDALLADCADLHEEQLMYYIEQLSDLSNSLRNAGNRRTLTEITLITLCRPQARPRADGSVLARLDRIEKQLEEGTFTAAPASSGSAPGSPAGGEADALSRTGAGISPQADDGGTDPAEEELPAEIAPELFQKIAQQWDATVSSMKEIGWGKLLAECSTPLFEKGDAGTLYIRVDDVWLRAFQNNERAARMAEEAIEKRFRARIRVKFVGARDAKDGGRLSAIASAVKDLEADIRFPVDLEDGEE